MTKLFNLDLRTISEHLQTIFKNGELQEDSVIRKFRSTAADRDILQDSGSISAETVRIHAESEFEKYRIVQDRLFESDFDRAVKEIEAHQKPEGEK